MCFSHGGELDQTTLILMIETLMELKFRVGHFKGTHASIAKKVIEKIKGTKTHTHTHTHTQMKGSINIQSIILISNRYNACPLYTHLTS